MKIRLGLIINCCLLAVVGSLLIASTTIYFISSLQKSFQQTTLSIGGDKYQNIKEVHNFKTDFETKSSVSFHSVSLVNPGGITTDEKGEVLYMSIQGAYQKDEKTSDWTFLKKEGGEKDYRVHIYQAKEKVITQSATVLSYLNAVSHFDSFWGEGYYYFDFDPEPVSSVKKGELILEDSKYVVAEEEKKGSFFSISVYADTSSNTTINIGKDIYFQY